MNRFEIVIFILSTWKIRVKKKVIYSRSKSAILCHILFSNFSLLFFLTKYNILKGNELHNPDIDKKVEKIQELFSKDSVLLKF